jgi:alkylhydroperoxidase family enzyme
LEKSLFCAMAVCPGRQRGWFASELEHIGESGERIHLVAAWRETPYFSDAERAALALTEAATGLADRPDPVPDEVCDEADAHYTGAPARGPGRGDRVRSTRLPASTPPPGR